MFTASTSRDAPPEPMARPAWIGPPEDELGRAVDVATVLGRSDTGLVAFAFAVAYSTGVSLNLHARATGLKSSDTHRLFHEQHAGMRDDDEELPDGFLRVGIELPGGALVSNLGGHRWPSSEPDGPVLHPSGGGGGQSSGHSVEMHPGYWLYPLVGEGTMQVSVEWPLVGIAFTTVELDATPFREAGLRAVKL